MKHKDHYNDDYIFSLSQKILSVMPDFDEKTFCHSLIGRLDDKELYARLDFIVDAMQESMPEDYSKNIQIFFNLLGPELKQSQGMFNFGWWLWPVGRYVERYGNENWILSLSFLKEDFLFGVEFDNRLYQIFAQRCKNVAAVRVQKLNYHQVRI